MAGAGEDFYTGAIAGKHGSGMNQGIRLGGVFLGASLLVVAGLFPVSAPAVDLGESWRLALQSDPELAAARAELDALGERVLQTRASLLPQMELQANTSDNKRVIHGPGSDEGFNNHDWGATLTQPIVDFPDWYGLKAARSEDGQRQAELAARIQALMVTTATEYFDVLRAIDDQASAQAAETAFASRLEQTKEKFDVGLIAITDVHEAQAAHDAARVERIIADGVIDIRREILESRIGRPFERVAALVPDMPVEMPEPMDRDQWIAVAMDRNQNLEAARRAVEGARLVTISRRSEHLPEVDLFASYIHSVQGGASFLGGKVDNRVLGLRLTVPLLSGGRTSARVREAHYLEISSGEQVRAVERDIRQSIRLVHRQAATNVIQLQALKQALVSARSALQATETGYEVGTRNAVEVLQARQAMHRAERDHANARYDYVINMLRLQEAAGTLSANDIQALNRWLQ